MIEGGGEGKNMRVSQGLFTGILFLSSVACMVYIEMYEVVLEGKFVVGVCNGNLG